MRFAAPFAAEWLTISLWLNAAGELVKHVQPALCPAKLGIGFAVSYDDEILLRRDIDKLTAKSWL
jgi:hypothetical protein